MVLADRGFTISDSVGIRSARVIGLLRNKFRILKHTLPVEMLTADEKGSTVLDKIAFVCAALVNLCDSLVPFG
ncbi:hypothetical protein MRX96_002525 [Rhipicephalus microplus]